MKQLSLKKCRNIIIQILTILILIIFLNPAVALAINQTLKLNVPLGDTTEINLTGEPLYQYLSIWYGFIIGTVGILATVMIMWAGIKWLTSRGNSATIGDAKEKIWSAIIGLMLAFLSFTILYLINPALTVMKTPRLGDLGTGTPTGNGAANGQTTPPPTNPPPTSNNAMTNEEWNRLMNITNFSPLPPVDNFRNYFEGPVPEVNRNTVEGLPSPLYSEYQTGVNQFYNTLSQGLGPNDYVRSNAGSNTSASDNFVPGMHRTDNLSPTAWQNDFRDWLGERGINDSNATFTFIESRTDNFTFRAIAIHQK